MTDEEFRMLLPITPKSIFGYTPQQKEERLKQYHKAFTLEFNDCKEKITKITEGVQKPGLKSDDKQRYMQMREHCLLRGKQL